MIEVRVESTEEGEALRGFRIGLTGVLATEEGKFADTTGELEGFFVRLLSQSTSFGWYWSAAQSLEELKTLALELLVATHEDQPGLLIDGIDEALVEALGDIDGIGGGDQCCGTQGRKTTAPRGVETASEELGNPPRPILWVVELRVQLIRGLVSWRRASANWATMSAREAA
jgi:hypothetical protein